MPRHDYRMTRIDQTSTSSGAAEITWKVDEYSLQDM